MVRTRREQLILLAYVPKWLDAVRPHPDHHSVAPQHQRDTELPVAPDDVPERQIHGVADPSLVLFVLEESLSSQSGDALLGSGRAKKRGRP
jgi:hypothetical protein